MFRKKVMLCDWDEHEHGLIERERETFFLYSESGRGPEREINVGKESYGYLHVYVRAG